MTTQPEAELQAQVEDLARNMQAGHPGRDYDYCLATAWAEYRRQGDTAFEFGFTT